MAGHLVTGAQGGVDQSWADITTVPHELSTDRVFDRMNGSGSEHVGRERYALPGAEEGAVEGEAGRSMARVAGGDEESEEGHGRGRPVTMTELASFDKKGQTGQVGGKHPVAGIFLHLLCWVRLIVPF